MVCSSASQIGGRHARACSNYSVSFALTLTASAGPSRARSVTECTKDHVCYCVDQDLQSEIQKKVAEIRARIAAERAQGKAIGYLSIPISSAGGGYNKVNGQVAKETADRVVTRLGALAAWVLNTASDEVKLSGDARGPRQQAHQKGRDCHGDYREDECCYGDRTCRRYGRPTRRR